VALYMGFIGMTVPFAFAVAALATGQLGNTWIKLIRKWTSSVALPHCRHPSGFAVGVY